MEGKFHMLEKEIKPVLRLAVLIMTDGSWKLLTVLECYK